MRVEETTDPRGVILKLEGEADLAAVPVFQGTIRKHAEAKTPALVIDFTEVTFVNTPIWAVLVEYYQATSEAGTKFAVAGLNGRVEASFEIVQLGKFIETFPTVEEALGGLA